MSRRLLLQLAKAGRVTRWQIETVLEAQVLYYGALSDLLLKMGYMSESDLLDFISHADHLPILSNELLEKISPRMTGLLPRDIVFRLRCLPVGLQNGRLVTAFSRAPSAETIKEIRIFVGMEIQAALTAEKNLLTAMLKHYAVRPSSLLLDSQSPILAIRHELEDDDLREEAESKPGFLPFHKDTYLADSGLSEQSKTIPFEGFADRQAGLPPLPDAASRRAKAESGIQVPKHTETEDVDMMSDDLPDVTAHIESLSEEIQEVDIQSVDASELQLQLEHAENRDAIVKSALEWLQLRFDPVIFFTVKKSSAVGFSGAGVGLRQEILKDISVGLNIESAFAETFNSRQTALLPCAGDSAAEMVLNILGSEAREALLLLPVEVGGKIIGIIAAFGAMPEAPENRAEAWHQVSQVISSGFEALILSRKVGV